MGGRLDLRDRPPGTRDRATGKSGQNTPAYLQRPRGDPAHVAVNHATGIRGEEGGEPTSARTRPDELGAPPAMSAVALPARRGPGDTAPIGALEALGDLWDQGLRSGALGGTAPMRNGPQEVCRWGGLVLPSWELDAMRPTTRAEGGDGHSCPRGGRCRSAPQSVRLAGHLAASSRYHDPTAQVCRSQTTRLNGGRGSSRAQVFDDRLVLRRIRDLIRVADLEQRQE